MKNIKKIRLEISLPCIRFRSVKNIIHRLSRALEKMNSEFNGSAMLMNPGILIRWLTKIKAGNRISDEVPLSYQKIN
ncbi:MAG: hypothetical protein NTW49_12165 [Bacteroidia bacterium]|nr:hypothetical protein [Bacteroidia bacterium]